IQTWWAWCGDCNSAPFCFMDTDGVEDCSASSPCYLASRGDGVSSSHAENMNRFYSRKWQGHQGYWLETYPPSAQVYALTLGKAPNDAIAMRIPSGLETVLEVGCGVGDLMVSLSQRSRIVIGLDIAEANVRMACQNLLNDGIANVVVSQGSAEE